MSATDSNDAKLAQAIELLQQVQHDLSVPASVVVAGTNLQALLGTLSGGETLILAPDFIWRGDLDLPKPVTIAGTGRLIGAVRVLAPDVAFRAGVQFEGRHKDHTILSFTDRTLVEDCTLLGSPQGQHRGISVNNSVGGRVRRTSITNIWHDSDAQCISGDYGVRDLLVEDCPRLEASGENIMFGGSDSPSAAAIPRDIIIRRCYLAKLLAWRTLANCSCKNLFEVKCVKNLLVEDVTMEYSFVKNQTGFAVLLNVRNQNGLAPWSTIEDVTMRRITIRHVAGGINLLGTDDTPGKPSQTMKRVLLEDWTIEDLSNEWGNNQQCLQMALGGEDVTLRRMKFSGPRAVNAMMTFEGAPWTRLTVEGCEFDEGYYGIHSPDFALGVKTLEHYAPGYTWSNNIVHSRRAETGRTIPYPTGTIIR